MEHDIKWNRRFADQDAR
jgi:hypothetical protein